MNISLIYITNSNCVDVYLNILNLKDLIYLRRPTLFQFFIYNNINRRLILLYIKN